MKRIMQDISGRARIPFDEVRPGSTLDYALRYAVLGWNVFPVHAIQHGHCTCGQTDCRNPGKHPIAKLAPHGFKDATCSPETIRAWFTDHAHNIAVGTGRASGIVVIDLDVKPERGVDGRETWQALLDEHGYIDTAMAITGSGGHHLIFAYPTHVERITNGTNVLGPGVDVRADGGYIVVEPSQHISGRGYAWEGSSDPTEGFPIADMPTWLLDALTARDTAPTAVTPASERALTSEQILELRSALAWIDANDYHQWIEIGMALHASRAGQQAFGIWDEWSQKSTKYNAKEMGKKWRSFSNKGFDGVDLPTVFARAQAAGWVNPASNAAKVFDQKEKEFREIFAAAERQAKVRIVEPNAPAVSPFPVPQLDELAGWIDKHAMMSLPIASRQAALALVCGATARRFVSSAGDLCQAFLGIVTGSVGEARYTCHAIERAFAAAEQRQLIRSSRFSSPQSLYRALLQSPSMLYLCSDYGPQIAFARRQPSGLLEQAMHLLATVWSGQDLQIDPYDDLGAAAAKAMQLSDALAVIHRPSLSMLALVSDDHLGALFRGSEMGRGAVEQILFSIPGDETDAQLREPGNPPVPAWLAEHLQTLLAPETGGNLATIGQRLATMPPVTRTVAFRVNTREQGEALRDLVRSERRLWPLAVGAHATLRRLATAMSAWADPGSPAVTRPILDWCTEYVLSHLRYTIEHYRILGTDDGQASVYDKTLEAIAKTGSEGITQRELAKRCWLFRKAGMDARAKLIESLLADDQIFELKRGRATVFVLRKYVQVEGETQE